MSALHFIHYSLDSINAAEMYFTQEIDICEIDKLLPGKFNNIHIYIKAIYFLNFL